MIFIYRCENCLTKSFTNSLIPMTTCSVCKGSLRFIESQESDKPWFYLGQIRTPIYGG